MIKRFDKWYEDMEEDDAGCWVWYDDHVAEMREVLLSIIEHGNKTGRYGLDPIIFKYAHYLEER